MDMSERKFYPIRGKIGAVGINITGAAEHAHEVERVIIIVK